MKYRNRVKQLRESRGWSQRDLASKLGLNPASVALWETGANNLSLNSALALADLFSCSLDEVLGREVPDCTPA